MSRIARLEFEHEVLTNRAIASKKQLEELRERGWEKEGNHEAVHLAKLVVELDQVEIKLRAEQDFKREQDLHRLVNGSGHQHDCTVRIWRTNRRPARDCKATPVYKMDGAHWCGSHYRLQYWRPE